MPFSKRMSWRHRWRLGLVLMAAVGGTTSLAVAADPFWTSLFNNRSVEADPQADYELKKENGPWLIIACTFSGDGADAQAREVVLELRSRFHLRAYHYEMDFDFDDSTGANGAVQTGGRRLRYQREESREIAVLVGDFSSIDDPQAQKTLEEIKHIVPHALIAEERGSTNQNFALLRAVQSALRKDDDASEGPMNKAFVARNPLLPKEYFVAPGVDELVASMNEGVPFSLLECPGNYTIQVATFTGSVILDQKVVQEYEEKGRLPKSKHNLEEAALNAHKLTLLLRDKGYEAYEFHDRYCSIVTVGSFAAVGAKRPDGKIDLDPRIYRTIQTFQGTPLAGGFGSAPGYQVKTVGAEKIPLDIQPQILPVPRRPAAAVRAGR